MELNLTGITKILLEIGGAGFWTVLGSQNHRDHFLLFHHKITKEKKTKEFFVSVPKNMGFIQVEESHHGYLSEMLTGDAFSERILGNLDVSVAFVLSTIAKSEKNKKLDFHFGKMFPRRTNVLVDWIGHFLAANVDSCVLFFNTCAEKQDTCISQCANVFYYHDRILNADKVVHVVLNGFSEAQILQSFIDAETSTVAVGAAISGVSLRTSDLYKDVSNDRLFELLDSALYLILGICDGEAWCFWPTRKLSAVTEKTFSENLGNRVDRLPILP